MTNLNLHNSYEVQSPVQSEDGTTYGYARVSTVQQSLELQIDSLLKYGIEPENIYKDKITGTTMHRKELDEMLSKVKTGDTIVVKKLDRLGRSVSQVTSLVDKLSKEGVTIIAIDDNIDTSNNSAMAKMLLQLMAMFAEMERNFIVDRTKPAIEAARKNGVKFGRPKLQSGGVYDAAIQEYLNKEYTVKDIIRKYGKDSNGKDLITEATFFRRLRKYKEDLEKGITPETGKKTK